MRSILLLSIFATTASADPTQMPKRHRLPAVPGYGKNLTIEGSGGRGTERSQIMTISDALTKPDHLSEVHALRYEVLLLRLQALQAPCEARPECKAAQEAVKQYESQIRAEYQIGDSDRIDLSTGKIVRVDLSVR